MSIAIRSGRSPLGLNAAEWATIVIGLAAATLPAVLPLMVGVLARQFGLGTERAGYVIAMNMGGILAGSLSCVLLSRRFGWGPLIAVGLCIMVAGNGLTMMTTSLSALVGSRLVSGWGEGVVGACCYALMGKARLPGRSIGFYTGGQAIVGAAGLALLPWLMATYGWHVFYVIVSLVAIPALLLTPLAVRGRERAATKAANGETLAKRPTAAGLGALIAIFMFFVGIAMIWAFMERLGVRQDLGLTHLSMALSASSIAGLAGSLLAGAVADRLRPPIGLALGIGLIIFSLAALLTSGFYPYMAAICGLSFAWAYQFPFLFGCLASSDRGGGIAVMTPVATGGALTVGPAIGGFVLEHGGVAMLCLGCSILTVSGSLLAAWLRMRGSATSRNALSTTVSNIGEVYK